MLANRDATKILLDRFDKSDFTLHPIIQRNMGGIMSIKIRDYEFEGPYTNTGSFLDSSGVYAILDKVSGKYYVLDIGESATVKTRIDTHDRANCWHRNCKGTLHYAVHYTPYKQSAGRMEIEQELRDFYNPVCGKQ